MKSVLYVTTSFPTLGAFVENEVRRLVERGVRVRVVTLRPVSRQYQPEHAHLLAITEYVGSPFDPAGWGALLTWLVRRPHVFVPCALRLLWSARGSAYAFAGHAGYLPAAARVASMVERGGFERVHGAWAHFPGSVAWLAARLTGARFSMAAHAGGDLYHMQAFLTEKAVEADFVTCCVRGNAEMLRNRTGGRGRIVWLYHGTDLRKFGGAPRSRAGEPTLVMVGRLDMPKGFDDAMLALGLLRRRGLAPRVVIVGEGPQRERLEEIAREQGVAEQVRFTGALNHDELLPIYGSAWALVAPSKVMPNGRRDGIPNVVIEAMAMGVPCIGTRATGIDEAVRPGETGFLCEPGNAASLAEALADALADPVRLERLGEGARRFVGSTFDAEANFERLLELFEGRPAPGEGGGLERASVREGVG